MSSRSRGRRSLRSASNANRRTKEFIKRASDKAGSLNNKAAKALSRMEDRVAKSKIVQKHKDNKVLRAAGSFYGDARRAFSIPGPNRTRAKRTQSAPASLPSGVSAKTSNRTSRSGSSKPASSKPSTKPRQRASSDGSAGVFSGLASRVTRAGKAAASAARKTTGNAAASAVGSLVKGNEKRKLKKITKEMEKADRLTSPRAPQASLRPGHRTWAYAE